MATTESFVFKIESWEYIPTHFIKADSWLEARHEAKRIEARRLSQQQAELAEGWDDF